MNQINYIREMENKFSFNARLLNTDEVKSIYQKGIFDNSEIRILDENKTKNFLYYIENDEVVILYLINLTEHIPEQVSKMTNIRYLYLSYYSYEQVYRFPHMLDKVIFKKESIKTNNKTIINEQIYMNQIVELCLNLPLANLYILDINSCIQLQKLSLAETQIDTVPEWIGKLTALQQLDLNGTQISSIPEWIGKLTALQQLDLSGTRISSIPEWIGKLTTLQQLDLSGTRISSIPEWIGKLTALQQLYLSRTRISSIPEWIGKLTALQQLDLSGTQISSIPEGIGKLTALQQLYLSGTQISSIPEWIGKLTALQLLDLSGTQISSIPEWIGKLTALQQLYLRGTQISSIPEWIGKLTALQQLDLSRTRISSIPEGIGKLTALQRLDLSYTQISSIPEWIGKLTALQLLDLSGTQISSIPEWIGKLTALQQLYLNGTRISSIPEWIGKLTALQQLDLSGTQISSIPEWIGKLTALQLLYLSGTQISSIPEWIGKLTVLQQLDLSRTRISSIPEWIGKLTALQQLYLSNTQLNNLNECVYNLPNINFLDISQNSFIILDRKILNLNLPFKFELDYERQGIYVENLQLEEMDVHILKKSKEDIAFYFDELEKNMGFLNEARVILIGDGDAGKSTIVNRLMTGEFQKFSTTPGISIRKQSVKIEGEDILVHYWDFGGQEIMHSTHELFLRNNCVYIIVLDGRKEDRPEYWLEFVRNYGRNSPVMIVINKCDEGREEIFTRTELIDDGYGDILKKDSKIYHISAKTGEGFSEFKTCLYQLIMHTKGYKKRWPGPWIGVKKSLESMKNPQQENINYIDEDQFWRYCVDAGIENHSNQDALLRWMDDLGIVFSYHSSGGIGMVEELKVLQPEWITNGIYKIINSKELDKYRGLIPVKEIHNVLKSPTGVFSKLIYHGGELDFVIGLMRDFKYSYAVGDKEFIPMLTQKERMVNLSEWDNSDIRFQYRFKTDVPGSLLYQLIVKMADDVKIEATWRRGTILVNNFFDIKALLYVETSNLNICIKGEHNSVGQYLAIIRNNIDQLTKDSHFIFEQHIGFYQKSKWYYLWLNRVISMLADNHKKDFVDGLNEMVDLSEILFHIMPDSVIKQLKEELNMSRIIAEKERNTEEKLNKICEIVSTNHVLLNEVITKQLERYFLQMTIDSNIIISKIEDLQKQIARNDSATFKKLDEAICEVKSGNRKGAFNYIKDAIGAASTAVSASELSALIFSIFK